MNHLSMWSVLILRETGRTQMASQRHTELVGIPGHSCQTCDSITVVAQVHHFAMQRYLLQNIGTRTDPGCFPRTAKSRRWSLRRCRARSFRCLLPHLAANEWLMSHKVGHKQRRRGLFCFALQAAEDRWLAWPWHSIGPSSEADKHPR